jgi:molybdopterin-guanine dinucleotide biosynthesis protein A
VGIITLEEKRKQMNNPNGLHGILLAGGKSSRMGTPKHLISMGGRTMLMGTLALLNEFTHSQTIIVNDMNDLPPTEGVRVLGDPPEFLHKGPIAGIVAGMRNREGWHLVLACDLPFMNEVVIRKLLIEIESHGERIDVVYPVYKGEPHPLIGFYHSRCLPVFEQALHEGVYKVKAVLAQVKTREICFDDWSIGAECFFNMNTPEDARIALEKMKSR